MTFKITKKTRKRDFLYEVVDENGNIVGKRQSPKPYVACGVQIVGGVPYVRNWFGRMDLVGKGESARYIGKPGSYVAVLEENPQQGS